MHRAPLIAALLLAACAKSSSGTNTPAAARSPGDLTCPEGTDERGAGPPAGLELYCARTDLRGRTLKHGPYRRWHTPDQLAERGSFYDNARHGAWTETDPRGTLTLEAHYIEGEPDGPWTAYHPSGARAETGQYADGERSGHWQFFDNHEQLQREGTYTDGQQDGVWVFYDEGGEPSLNRTYRRGRVISQTAL